MNNFKKLKKTFLNFAKSIDTMTTKFLTLVLFVTLIPLMAVGSFSSDIIGQGVSENAQSALDSNYKLLDYSYRANAENIIRTTSVMISDSQNSKVKNIGSLNDLAIKTKNVTGAALVAFLDRENRVIGSSDSIYRISGNLARLSGISRSGDTIVSYAKIQPGDLYNNQKYNGLCHVMVFPVKSLGGRVGVVLIVNKFGVGDTIPTFIKNSTDTNVVIYEIKGDSALPVSFYGSKPRPLSDKTVINAMRSGNALSAKTLQPYGMDISKYYSVKNYFGKPIGSVYVGISEDKVFAPVNLSIAVISKLSVISLILAIFIAAFFARSITTPILKLVAAAQSIASGDLKQRVKIKGNDEIAKLSSNFNIMAENLQKQERLRDNFIATLTHDLKVPMLAENQTITYFLNSDYGPITEEQNEVLKLIRSTNKSSLEMVTTLLEVSRYDSGHVQMLKTDFDVVKLVRQSIEEIKSLAEEKKISIEISSDVESLFLTADEREIKRVLHNLVSNAIYNGILRGKIRCDISYIAENKRIVPATSLETYSTLVKPLDISDAVLISIKDDGVGILREDMPQLFKRFSLNKGRKPAGTGLGLYYSHQVVTSHGGNIWVESSEGAGSTFSFYIPLHKQEVD